MTTDANVKFRAEVRRRKRLREITMHFVLLLVVFMYSFAGAKIFQSIEEKHEETVTGDLIKSKHDFLDSISEGVGSEKLDKKNWTLMVERLLNYYVEDLAEATSHGVDITDVTQHEYESAKKWDFWGSLFYAGTVYTTIGYGNFAPVTPEGKIVTIIYGTIGIPLCLILLADLGNLIAKLIKCGVKKVKKQLYSGTKKNMRELWPPQDEIDQMTGRSTFFVLNVLCFLYLFLGAYMYKTWEEDWTYLDAVYFIFVSTSTIGFGDVLPSQPKKFIFSSLYIFFGLSLLSAAFTVLQDLLEGQISDAKVSVDYIFGIHQTDQEKKLIEDKATSIMEASQQSETKEHITPTTVNNNNSEPMVTTRRRDNTETASRQRASDASTAYQRDVVDTIRPRVGVREEPVAVEESIISQAVNNNTMSAPPTKTVREEDIPVVTIPYNSVSLRSGRVSETKLISSDENTMSVEATIILDN